MIKLPSFLFLDQCQYFIMFYNSCFDLSANFLNGYMYLVLERNVQAKCSVAYCTISSQRPAFFSLTQPTRSSIHRHTKYGNDKEEHQFYL